MKRRGVNLCHSYLDIMYTVMTVQLYFSCASRR